MNFFEQELRKLFDDGKIIGSPSYKGIPVVFEQEPPQHVRLRKRSAQKGGWDR